MRLKCVIIEDEPLAMTRAVGFVEKIDQLELVATFENALEGLSYLKNNPVDLLFLDINMDELSGIELLGSFPFQGKTIITTAYDEYALKGYELNVTDYLLKPYTFERFLKAVNKVEDHFKLNDLDSKEYLFVKTENRLEKVLFDDILYIEGMRDYRRIHLKSKKIMTLQTFSEFERIFPSKVLCRVHKSYMIAPNKIESIQRMRISIAGELIPISETYKDVFFSLIQ